MFVGMDHHSKGPTSLCNNSPSSTDKPHMPINFPLLSQTGGKEPKGRSYSHMQKGNRIARRVLSKNNPFRTPEASRSITTTVTRTNFWISPLLPYRLQLTVRHHRLHAYHILSNHQKIRRKHEFSGQRKCCHT